MRHLLTDGGMTDALSDAVLLTLMLVALPDLVGRREVLHSWHWARKPLVFTINISYHCAIRLSGADGTSPFSRRTHSWLLFTRTYMHTDIYAY